MIQEAYVSFEVAKLLKEKGFLIVTPDWYYVNGEWEHHNSVDFQNNNIDNIIPACTQQMAMRWLREEHNISIEISSCCKIANCEPVDLGWAARKIDLTKMVGSAFLIGRYATYEMACDAAIKYCLENLNLI